MAKAPARNPRGGRTMRQFPPAETSRGCSNLHLSHSHEQHDFSRRHHHDVRRHRWGWQRCWRLRRRQGRRGRRLRDLRHAQVANREARRHEVAHASSLRSPLSATAIKPREVLSFPQRDDERNSWVAQGVGEWPSALLPCPHNAEMGLVGGRMAAAHRGAVEKVQYFAYHPRSPYSVIPGAVSGVSDSLFRLQLPRRAVHVARTARLPVLCVRYGPVLVRENT